LRRFGPLPTRERFYGVSKTCKTFLFQVRSREPVSFTSRSSARKCQQSNASSESEHSSDDSGAGDDPPRSSAVPNSLLQLQCAYASDSDSVVAATPEKQFEEEDGLSDGSEFHTPAQPSKRRRLPSVSPVQKRQVDVQDVDSDGFDRDSLFDPPSTRKRGFKGPRQP
jgi:hypothetical protein